MPVDKMERPRSSPAASDQPSSVHAPSRGQSTAASQPLGPAGAAVAHKAPTTSPPPPPPPDRSPSTIPAVEAVPPVTRDDMITSSRYETLLPQAQGTSDSAAHQNQCASTAPASPSEGRGDAEEAAIHIVPLPPLALQRDEYRNHIYYDRSLIARVLEARHLDAPLLADSEALLEKLRNIAMHPDLINPETESQPAEAERQAKWDVKCSAKFRFLKDFLERVSDRDMHVAIVTHGRRVPAMLHHFLRGIDVPHARYVSPPPADPDLPPSNWGLKVSIVDLGRGVPNVHPADVVIALNPSIDDRHPVLRALRKRRDGENWSPLLILAVPQTLEHMEYYLRVKLPRPARARLLIHATHELSWDAGKREGTQSPREDAAHAIATYLEDATVDWPIAGLAPLEILDALTPPSVSVPLSVSPASAKRPPSETELDADVSKRARLSPAPAERSGTVDPYDLDTAPAGADVGNGAHASVHARARHAPAPEQRLRELLQSAQDRLDEHIRALEDLQYCHEAQRKELIDVKRERDRATAAARAATARAAAADHDAASSRAERSQLQLALAEARADLLHHSVPERRELELLRNDLRCARADTDKAERRAAADGKDLEWTRSMYQDASQHARDLAQSNAQLEAALADAAQRARAEPARAAHHSAHARARALELESRRLRHTTRHLRRALLHRDSQLRLLHDSRPRPPVRPSSLPRSPRPARHPSPSHPLRNA